MPGSELVQSLTRGLEIIQMAAKTENGIRVNEAAEALDVKFPTAHNLIRTLVAKAFLKKTEANTYVLGNAFYDAITEHSNRDFLKKIESILRKIVGRFPDSVIIFTEESNNRIFKRLRMSPDLPGQIQKPFNDIMPLYSSASGLSYLAFADEDAVDELMRENPFHENGITLWKSIENLKAFLADARKRGFAFPVFEETQRIPLSIPFYGKDGKLRGTIGITSNATSSANKQIKEQVSTIENILKEIEITY